MQDGHVVRADGTQEWRLGGKLHREGDQPARILASGTREWYLHGQLHRDGDKPAHDDPGGTQEWHLHGRLHRHGDQPARILANGTRVWYCNGQLHREGDQPAYVAADGMQQWWMRGMMKRGERVTDFRPTSTRFALVQAVVAIGVAACVPCGTHSAVNSLLQAVHALPCGALSYHVAHEHAFLVALFL